MWHPTFLLRPRIVSVRSNANGRYWIGMAQVFLSAAVFGVCPTIMSASYRYGVDSYSGPAFRALFALLPLFFLCRIRGISLRIDKKEAGLLATAGVFGLTTANILFCTSYSIIPVGVATSLHFTYPALTCLLAVLLFREKITAGKLLSLLMAVAGVFICADFAGGSYTPSGIVLALLSAVSYTFLILFLSHTGLGRMNTFCYTFYVSLCVCLCGFVFSAFTGHLTFNIAPMGWMFLLLAAIANLCIALPLFAMGLRKISDTTATVLSTLEPVVSVICATVLLGEKFRIHTGIGCLLVVGSAVLLTAIESRCRKR